MQALSIDGFHPRPTLPHPAFPVTSTAVSSSPNLCALCVGVYPERLGVFSFLPPRRHPERSEGSPFLSFLGTCYSLLAIHCSLLSAISFNICTSAKPACNPCRMRSFKTQDLKPFRMCSSEKPGWGGDPQLLLFSAPTPRTAFTPTGSGCRCLPRAARGVILIPSLPPVGCELSTVSFLPHLFRGPNEVN
jgi:hypothetical protein